jgi:hypothetical protein
VSPTHYVFEGQKRSGLLGPVTLRVADALDTPADRYIFSLSQRF